MTGPEHFKLAERLIEDARTAGTDAMHQTLRSSPTDFEAAQRMVDILMARAQVHATLALAAATANTPHLADAPPLADQPSAWDGDYKGDGPTWKSVLS